MYRIRSVVDDAVLPVMVSAPPAPLTTAVQITLLHPKPLLVCVDWQLQVFPWLSAMHGDPQAMLAEFQLQLTIRNAFAPAAPVLEANASGVELALVT
jgi:hypothetical protein